MSGGPVVILDEEKELKVIGLHQAAIGNSSKAVLLANYKNPYIILK
jgi:hypothetical protein